MSLAELARLTGLSKTTIADVETGQIKDLKLSTLVKLADYFGCGLDYLTGYDELHNIKRQLVPPSLQPSVLEFRRSKGLCVRCAAKLRRGEIHLLEDCVMHLHERGVSRERTGMICECGSLAVDGIIADVMSRRLGRRLPRFITGTIANATGTAV